MGNQFCSALLDSDEADMDSHAYNTAISLASPSAACTNNEETQAAQEFHAEQDAKLERVWNSDVVGEVVKKHSPQILSIADDNQTVLQVVQAMVKSGNNYCIIRRHDPTSNVSDETRSIQTFAGKRKDVYVGLFDWRDLNALIVMVCKQSRLHAGGVISHSVQPISAPKPDKLTIPASSIVNSEVNPRMGAEWTSSPRIGDKRVSPLLLTQTKTNPGTKHVPLNTIDRGNQSMLLKVDSENKSGPAIPRLFPTSVEELDRTEEAVAPEDNALAEYLHFLDMKRTPVGLLVNLSQSNKMQTVSQVCPLLGGARVLLAKNNNDNTAKKRSPWSPRKITPHANETSNPSYELYRLTVLDKNGQFVGCLTQIGICAWIRGKMPLLGESQHQSLLDLGLTKKRVITISWKSSVLNAITLMNERRLSALAIVNDTNGKLVGTVSCSDVKYLFAAPDLLLTLERPISVFIQMLRQSSSFWHVNLASNALPCAQSQSVTVTQRSSLLETVNTLVQGKVRRAWIVNDNHQPCGYISVSDILRHFLPNLHSMSKKSNITVKSGRT